MTYTRDHVSAEISGIDGASLPEFRLEYRPVFTNEYGMTTEECFRLRFYGSTLWFDLVLNPAQFDRFIGDLNNKYLAALDDLVSERDLDGVTQ